MVIEIGPVTTVADGALGFFARQSGTTLIARPPFKLEFGLAGSQGVSVTDGNADGDVDADADFYQTGTPYSGFTIEIDGNDYALFRSGDFYFLPWFNSVQDLSPLIGTDITQPITFAGNNAEVVNLSCFFEGTGIATPRGEVPVETLDIGDLVQTADGRSVPIVWVGRKTVSTPVGLVTDARWAPVRIQAGTLGTHTDLYVSSDHGMIVDGLVIDAGALVNGDTVHAVPAAALPRAFTYYHIETVDHEVILANGAQAETFVDAAGRMAFDNYATYLADKGAERIIPAMNNPRISSARLVPTAIKARLMSGGGEPEKLRPAG